MNILFIHEVDWLQKVVFDIHFLAEALSLRGHKVYAIDYATGLKGKSIFDLKTSRVEGVSRAFPGSSVALMRPGFIRILGLSRLSVAVTSRSEIERTIREEKIDVIILYAVPTMGWQTVRLARRFNIPVAFRSIDIVHRLAPLLLRPGTRFLETKIYSTVDLVLPNTPRYLHYVLNMGAPEPKVKLVPFPVDTGLFRPGADPPELRQKWGIREGQSVVLFIGTLFKFCGLDTFLREFPAVAKAVPGVRLLIVGDGPLRPKLERIILEKGLHGNVTITGFQPYETMPQYISMATVCINTFVVSDYTMDMFPAKIMQYVACGKATVATALRGITTILPGQSQGVVYVTSAAGVAREVALLLKSSERRQKLESAGVAYIRENHAYEKVAEKLEAILEQLIKEKRNAGRA